MKQLEDDNSPWVHIGECPVCVNGIARVRTCTGGGTVHLIAICDECEAIWTEPDISLRRGFADSEDPICPICSEPLYGPHSHWAMPIELEKTAWAAASILVWPSKEASEDSDSDASEERALSRGSEGNAPQTDSNDLVEPEDRATGC